MTPNPGAPSDSVTLSDANLLTLAQNATTPVVVLVRILEHPALSPEVLEVLLLQPQLPGAALASLAERASGPLLDVLLRAPERLERWGTALEALLRNPAVPAATRAAIQRQIELARRRLTGGSKNQELLRRIKDLSPGHKLTLAKKGNKDVRMLLIKDPIETVALEVVTSPRITDGEILAISQMRDVSDKVLRHIANDRRYRQNRQIVMALLNNPRTPVGVSLGLGVNSLTDRELRDLAGNRNIPGALSRAAEQILKRRKEGAGQPGGQR
jgi:hypothetical protein